MASLVYPPVLTSPRDDAMALYRAFKGFGCDTAAVINILAHRDATQRALIQQEYKTMYSDNLIKKLTKELSGDTERAILLWMHDPARRDAYTVREALATTFDIKAATEIICSRTPTQIQVFKNIYHSEYGVHLEQDIEPQDIDGDLKKLLLAYVSKGRYEGFEFDRTAVDHDAKVLFKAGEKSLGTDEKKFIKIFTERSSAHLAAVSSAYKSMYGSLEKAIKKETSGTFEFALLTILRCAENPAMYFARSLHKAMKGMGTNDTTLIRIVVTRTELDMQYIKDAYLKRYKKTLHDAIYSETSGNYRTFLLSLVGPNH